VASYVKCMQQHHINLPTPNFSGTGSVFGTGVNATTASFKTANAACEPLLKFLSTPSALGGTQTG